MWSQLRAVQRAHGQKRKAGLLFDEPLCGTQLAPPPRGAGMPPLRPTTDERRLQWMRVRLIWQGSVWHCHVRLVEH